MTAPLFISVEEIVVRLKYFKEWNRGMDDAILYFESLQEGK